MAVKFVVIFSALVAAAYGSFVSVSANQDSSSFSYDVADPNTGDYKSQTEVREGDVVRGQYSLLDPDGTYRIVDYTADDVNGFNAVVRKEPVAAGFAASTVVETPVVEASPVISARTAPVVSSVYQAPLAHAYTTPVLSGKTYATPVVTSNTYDSPALIAKTYSPSIYGANSYALPSIARTYASPAVVASNAYSRPVVYEPSVYSNDYYGSSYLSPYYSTYGSNVAPVNFAYYKK